MFGKWLLSLVVPLALVGALSACNGSSGAVQPGVVNTSAAGGYRGENGTPRRPTPARAHRRRCRQDVWMAILALRLHADSTRIL